MSMYYYAGVTAHIQTTPETKNRMALLAQAIPQLAGAVTPHKERLEDQQDVLEYNENIVERIQHLREENALIGLPKSALPPGTPDGYREVSLSEIKVKDIDFTRLYIPFLSEDPDDLHDVSHDTLTHVLSAVFGDTLTSVKLKYGDEYHAFDTLPVKVVLSADRFKTNA